LAIAIARSAIQNGLMPSSPPPRLGSTTSPPFRAGELAQALPVCTDSAVLIVDEVCWLAHGTEAAYGLPTSSTSATDGIAR
jgi:hypothetical protein